MIKHPLQNAWTLWFFKNDKARTWEENQRPIITVTTVEDFWSLYNHIEVASRLPPGSDYSLFKEGIFPDWEDPRNQPGGRWIINVDRRNRTELLDTYWLEILFFLIKEPARRKVDHQRGQEEQDRAPRHLLAGDSLLPYQGTSQEEGGSSTWTGGTGQSSSTPTGWRFSSSLSRNQPGGRWIINVDRRNRTELLDTYW